jgi:hypothetical protein
MPASRSILISIAILGLTVSIAPGLGAYPRMAPEHPGFSALAGDRVYLASGATDLDEEATIGDPGEQATIGDSGEQTTIGDPGEQATVGDSGEQATVGDPDEEATIGDPGEKSSF